jgi:hypothetical protein
MACAGAAPCARNGRPALALTWPGIRQTLEHAVHVFMALLVTFVRRVCELNPLGCFEKLLQLRNGTQLCSIHFDHHPWMIKPPVHIAIRTLRLIQGWKYVPPSGLHLIGQGCMVGDKFLCKKIFNSTNDLHEILQLLFGGWGWIHKCIFLFMLSVLMIKVAIRF